MLLFNQSYPYVSIDFKYYYDLETALETDLIDIGIGIFLDTSIPLEKELIYTESYLLCVNKNHPLAHADSVTIDEIRSLPFAAYSDQVYEKKVFKRWERKINWENRQIVIELPSLHLVLDMVQREKACSILPYSLTDELNRRNLVGIPLEDSPERAIYLVQNNQATLGAELFNRQGQTTTLTPAGLILEKYCWRITNELVSIEEELKEINHSSNHIYVATYLCDLEYKLNDLLMTTLTDRSSNLQVHTIITENILQSLETMDADFGISFADLPLPEHIGKIDLFTANYQFILRNDHPALAKATTEEILKELTMYPFVRLNTEFSEQNKLTNWLDTTFSNFSPEKVIQVDTLSLITHLVSHSDSFAIVPEYTNIQLLDNSIHTLTYQELPKRNMAVYYLKERYMSRQLQQLLAECQKQFQ